MSSDVDRIWCIEYDEDSYHHSLQNINFTKYLSNILSNQHFPAFQKNAAEELKKESEWNDRSWAILQFFQYLNAAFDPVVFQKKLQFVPIRKLRRVFGCFRMWLDLERLYLLLFLKTDRIQFQQDRIFFSLYRVYLFFNELLEQYETAEFDRTFLQQIAQEVKRRTHELSACMPHAFKELLQNIGNTFIDYVKGYRPGNQKFIDQIKKNAYQKLIRLYDMSSQVEDRLRQNVNFQNKYREMKEISSIVDDLEIQQKTESINKVYDPKSRIVAEFKAKCVRQNVPFDESKLQELLKQYQNQKKTKIPTQKHYQSIMRIGHNPYEQPNFAIYGEKLNIDMNDKPKLEVIESKQEEEVVIETDNKYMYREDYIEMAEKLNVNSAKVTNKDLKLDVIDHSDDKKEKKNSIRREWKEDGNLSKMKWQEYKDEEEKNKLEKYGEGIALSTMQSLNKTKNLDNNALFVNEEEEEMDKKIMAIKLMGRRGINSQALFDFEKKSQTVYDDDRSKILFSVKNLCVNNRHTFDGLRKVLQLAALEKSLNELIQQKSLPAVYPRNIDQIREFPSNPLIHQQKLKIAHAQIFFDV